jgi:hypothetical protein
MKKRVLGRLIEHDPRSYNYRALGVTDERPILTKTWRRGYAYDQGQTPMCVAYTGKGILNTTPVSATIPYYIRSAFPASAFYTGAQELDEWPGNDYDGTSALGLGKYLRSVGLITAYEWCFNWREVAVALSYRGPVGIGVGWRSAMWDTDSAGFLHPSGAVEGGHEVELIGVDARGWVIGMNSWGREWGVGGRFKLTFADLNTLLADQGDAVVLVR